MVLAPSIATANQYLEWLQKLGIKALKATSDESKEAQTAIKRFKKHYNYGEAKAVDALVTVAMAYEGLDVPAITHVACLTNIRSKPWLEQSWARAARVDREAGVLKKTGLIYLPDDKLAVDCVQKIMAEQAPILRKRELNKRENGGGNGDNDAKNKELGYNSIIALNSSLTRSRASDSSNGETVDYAETAILQSTAQEFGISGSTINLKRFMESYNTRRTSTEGYADSSNQESLTPSEELSIIRDKIENYVRYYTAKNGMEFKTINGEIVKEFGKSRKAMALEELRRVWAWLQSKYPMND